MLNYMLKTKTRSAGFAGNIEVIGDDYDVLIAEAEKIRRFINNTNIGGIEELKFEHEQILNFSDITPNHLQHGKEDHVLMKHIRN